MDPVRVERYPALDSEPGIRHGFVCRVPGVPVSTVKDEVIQALSPFHERAREALGLAGCRFITAGQVHGAEIAIVHRGATGDLSLVDGLITSDRDVCLGIYVADCCAIYVVDSVRRVIALLHSGKKGTELGILTHAIEKMSSQFGSNPADLIVQLSPCIRPPFYEVNIAERIKEQAVAAGVTRIHDCGENTGGDLESYYSYRVEKGNTGRMVALLGLVG